MKTFSTFITEIYEGGNWTDVSIDETLMHITWQQAQQKTAASKNTIASLVNHLWYWNEIIMQRINGENPTIPETNGFDVVTLKNDNDWNELKEKLHQSFLRLANAVKEFPAEKSDETYSVGKSTYQVNFQGIIEHAYYHLGQIVIIKNLVLNNG